MAGANTRLAELGPEPWLVLGGGGVKGMAHIGAWRWLQGQGWGFKGVVGCSIGALVGACIAADMDGEEMHRIASGLERNDIIQINRRAAWVNGIRAPSVFRGDPLREYIEEVLPVRNWDELWLPLQVNAVDLATGEVHWFGTGARTDVSLVDAIYASSALPVLYPPAEMAGSYYVDGGVDQALPLERAEAVGATGLLGIDCGSGPEADAEEVVEGGMIAVHQRVMSIMIRRRREELLEEYSGVPTIVVRPELDGYDTFDFDSVPFFLEEGYRAINARMVSRGADNVTKVVPDPSL
ncbi:MAG: patatin-like phospholipase family protein [Longimicrobiales bacterium]